MHCNGMEKRNENERNWCKFVAKIVLNTNGIWMGRGGKRVWYHLLSARIWWKYANKLHCRVFHERPSPFAAHQCHVQWNHQCNCKSLMTMTVVAVVAAAPNQNWVTTGYYPLQLVVVNSIRMHIDNATEWKLWKLNALCNGAKVITATTTTTNNVILCNHKHTKCSSSL